MKGSKKSMPCTSKVKSMTSKKIKSYGGKKK